MVKGRVFNCRYEREKTARGIWKSPEQRVHGQQTEHGQGYLPEREEYPETENRENKVRVARAER